MTDQLTHDPVFDDPSASPSPDSDGRIADGTSPAAGPESTYVWSEAPTKPRRTRRALLWSCVGGGVLLLFGAASVLLIAPGTTVAGVAVGGLPAGVATAVVSNTLADATIDVNGTQFTGRQLGLKVDAEALTDRAFAQRPLWNVGSWFGESIDASVAIDANKADAALQRAHPEFYTKPVNAAVTFAVGGYTATKAEPGTRVDTDALASSLSRSLTVAPGKLAAKATTEPVHAPLSTAAATTTATKLNDMLATMGFYVGTERTVPVAPDVAASWLTVTPNAEKGTFSITADQAKIQTAVDALPGQVNRAAITSEAIVNSSGEALKTIVAGQTARTLGDTGTVAKSFATQLSHGEATFALPVTEEALQTKNVQRSIEVDLGAQRTYMIENGAVVDSWAISSGLAATPTPTGHFKVFAHVRVQTMSSTQYGYSVPNVEWVMYFSGDDAFHGVYWHNNYGTPMSHGCVGMPISQAKALYEWSPDGIEVYVH